MSRLKWIKTPIGAAIAIAIAVSLWVLTGVLSGSGEKTMADPIQSADAAGAPATAVAVRVRTVHAEPHAADLVLRGRTESEHKVQLKAEMSGRVVNLPAAKGQSVKAGDPICELDVGARKAQLDQARAALKQAQLEYQAAVALEKKGHRSETQTAAALAAFEAAEANIRAQEQQLSYTVMRAPFDGIVNNRLVAVGDYMTPGTPCAWVVGAEPFLIVGAVSENQIAQFSPGTEGNAHLVTGETVTGTVTYLATAADATTRTFRVELTVPNPEFKLRDGVTADIRVRSGAVPAVRVSPAILSLDDNGRIGIKIVEANHVRFVAVTLIGDDKDGVWIAGLPEEAMIITVGQEYVKDGDLVDPIPEAAVTAGEAAPGTSAN
ncbi:Efflux pump periplasmic linker BepF [Alphaproteobacteria bacterium SO-S41]|nr:Efflux pump periplasmic linker BepF [Alphaproteobacteria bacterium SO-S41]